MSRQCASGSQASFRHQCAKYLLCSMSVLGEKHISGALWKQLVQFGGPALIAWPFAFKLALLVLDDIYILSYPIQSYPILSYPSRYFLLSAILNWSNRAGHHETTTHHLQLNHFCIGEGS
eukprot:scaffold277432_cov14-Prasinocladus_malaysianus.AAC.1